LDEGRGGRRRMRTRIEGEELHAGAPRTDCRTVLVWKVKRRRKRNELIE
jgi:hypothetical protein